MKPFKLILNLCLFCLACSAFCQDMKEGFNYLETGKYKQAEAFFENILKDYPDNKTARLCYGRAIGLNAKTKEALTLFTKLVQDYPNDFEVKLNYAESLLWDKQFTKARGYYRKLTQEEPSSFPALLGYANTLSNLKVYPEAVNYVDKALEVMPGNANAMTSKKYIYLGYAYQNQQAQDYKKADSLLLQNLKWFPEDKDILLNLANLYLITNQLDKANETYRQLGQQKEFHLPAQNGFALVQHLKGKDKKALLISEKAYSRLQADTDSALVKQTTERYIQALIWNKKFKAADQQIKDVMQTNPNENWKLALRATLNIYKSNFTSSLTDYNNILANDSASFDGNLGKANTLKALGRPLEAYQSANNTLTYYNNQKDAVNFINQLKIAYEPSLETKVSHTFDNGDNKAYVFQADVKVPLSTQTSLLGQYVYRHTNNDVTRMTAKAHNFMLGANYVLTPSITLTGLAGVANASAENNDFSQLLTELSASIKPSSLQNLEVGYRRQIESFNAELIDRELVQNNFYANYNLSTNFNLGWYTQLIYTSQNDGNQRNLLFTSLYYNVLAKPGIKVGLNYQHINFKDQLPTIYFSPEKFNAFEAFVNLIQDENAIKPKQWFYNFTGAFGLQYIEDDPSQVTYRLQGALGYKFTARSLLNVYGVHSNIASATAAGFTFSEIGLRFKWSFMRNAIFEE